MKLLYDFLPVILFYVTYTYYGIYPATVVAMIAAVVQLGGGWLVKRQVEKMHLVSLALIVVLGGMTLWLKDKSFFMLKPTLINALFAIAFTLTAVLTGKPLVQRLLGESISLPDPAWARLNWLWVGFFALSGLLNLGFVQHYRSAEEALLEAHPQTTEAQLEKFECASDFPAAIVPPCELAASREQRWANFKLFGLLGLTVLFIIAQTLYLSRYIEPEDAEAATNKAPEKP